MMKSLTAVALLAAMTVPMSANAAPVLASQAIPAYIAPGQAAPVQAQPAQSASAADLPSPARPTVRKRSSFFGLPLLGLLSVAGAGAAVAATAGTGQPVSPQ